GAHQARWALLVARSNPDVAKHRHLQPAAQPAPKTPAHLESRSLVTDQVKTTRGCDRSNENATDQMKTDNRTILPMVVEVLQGNIIHNHYVTVTK
ncbi:hypothetical protein RBA19_13360, partial [Mycobacteroides abscessus subsp. massiliense]